MERYTHKYDTIIAVDKDGTEHHSKGITVTDIKLAKEKLYKLENLEKELDVDLIEFLSELVYVLNHSSHTTGYTSKGKEITTDYGYVESFIEDLKNAIKDKSE